MEFGDFDELEQRASRVRQFIDMELKPALSDEDTSAEQIDEMLKGVEDKGFTMNELWAVAAVRFGEGIYSSYENGEQALDVESDLEVFRLVDRQMTDVSEGLGIVQSRDFIYK